MASECRCCGGRCGEVQPLELNRRDFLEKLAVGAAALAVTGQMAWADEADKLVPPVAPQSTWLGRYPLTPPRVYRGKHLEAVGMPLGGIGTGSIWLDGQGQLGVWQIFNNLSEPRDSRQLLRRQRQAGGGPGGRPRAPDARAKAACGRSSRSNYEGGYPIARLTFHDPALPVEVVLEAMNPMIPLDTANSSIPCALFRLTAKNPGTHGGRGRLLRHAAKRGRQPRGRRHPRRAVRRLRREPQPRGSRRRPMAVSPWTSRPTRSRPVR